MHCICRLASRRARCECSSCSSAWSVCTRYTAYSASTSASAWHAHAVARLRGRLDLLISLSISSPAAFTRCTLLTKLTRCADTGKVSMAWRTAEGHGDTTMLGMWELFWQFWCLFGWIFGEFPSCGFHFHRDCVTSVFAEGYHVFSGTCSPCKAPDAPSIRQCTTFASSRARQLFFEQKNSSLGQKPDCESVTELGFCTVSNTAPTYTCCMLRPMLSNICNQNSLHPLFSPEKVRVQKEASTPSSRVQHKHAGKVVRTTNIQQNASRTQSILAYPPSMHITRAARHTSGDYSLAEC